MAGRLRSADDSQARQTRFFVVLNSASRCHEMEKTTAQDLRVFHKVGHIHLTGQELFPYNKLFSTCPNTLLGKTKVKTQHG